eukprot:1188907-Prorocentrum_minimum.AAC.4
MQSSLDCPRYGVARRKDFCITAPTVCTKRSLFRGVRWGGSASRNVPPLRQPITPQGHPKCASDLEDRDLEPLDREIIANRYMGGATFPNADWVGEMAHRARQESGNQS